MRILSPGISSHLRAWRTLDAATGKGRMKGGGVPRPWHLLCEEPAPFVKAELGFVPRGSLTWKGRGRLVGIPDPGRAVSAACSLQLE